MVNDPEIDIIDINTANDTQAEIAIAAAQAEDAQLLDNYLYKLALNRSIRAPLAEAVKSLAACLAVHGYWLPQPPEAIPVPAAALRLARAQGHDLHDIHVAWP